MENASSCSHGIRNAGRKSAPDSETGLLVPVETNNFERSATPFSTVNATQLPRSIMKASLWLICALALTLVSGCVSQDTSKLSIGMTKEEVIKVMGEPLTVGADTDYEYLNYRVSSSTGSYGYLTQQYTVRLTNGHVISYGIGVPMSFSSRPLATSATMRTTDQNADANADEGIRIISMEPATAVVGKPTDFKFKVRYALKSSSDGMIQLSFNTLGPRLYKMAANQTVAKGTGEVEFDVTVTAKDWGELTSFTANAVLRNGTDARASRVLIAANREIPLVK